MPFSAGNGPVASSGRWNSSSNDRRADSGPVVLERVFGSCAFGLQDFQGKVRPSAYERIRATVEEGGPLDPKVADEAAGVLKDWAISKGATHFAHWFQPLTGRTAEKHESFLRVGRDGKAITRFSGRELVRGESDASPFPSGGLRATFEARGYTAWDPTSPAFILEADNAAFLCVPSVFSSWSGESLDTKLPLLRSIDALDRVSRRALRLFGLKPRRVAATLGPEQEFFLIDREHYRRRPDLMAAGRSLFGAKPPRGQEMDDHYFGSTHTRVLEYMRSVELDLYRLGVPMKTHHNEVAPGQFEMAPVHEDANLAADHQQLMMRILERNAHRFGLVCLLHEKPFSGLNGSGKHLNWSFGTEDQNLLDPGETPHENQMFLFFCTAALRAVERRQDILRASVATAGNDLRLGLNEAPPVTLSVFLGAQLSGILEELAESGSARETTGSGLLGLGVRAIPELPRHSSDRNRTAPIAFTGNKFEFRSLGSSASISFPAAVINTIVAESIEEMTIRLEGAISAGAHMDNALRQVLAREASACRRIVFDGDCYDKQWDKEARRRGLLRATSTPQALDAIASERTTQLFDRMGVMTQREMESRRKVKLEQYFHRVNIEGETTAAIARTMVLPAAIRYLEQLSRTLRNIRPAEIIPSKKLLRLAYRIGGLTDELLEAADALDRENRDLGGSTVESKATHMRDRVLPRMEEARRVADQLEGVLPNELWPLPTYREMLFVK